MKAQTVKQYWDLHFDENPQLAKHALAELDSQAAAAKAQIQAVHEQEKLKVKTAQEETHRAKAELEKQKIELKVADEQARATQHRLLGERAVITRPATASGMRSRSITVATAAGGSSTQTVCVDALLYLPVSAFLHYLSLGLLFLYKSGSVLRCTWVFLHS